MVQMYMMKTLLFLKIQVDGVKLIYRVQVWQNYRPTFTQMKYVVLNSVIPRCKIMEPSVIQNHVYVVETSPFNLNKYFRLLHTLQYYISVVDKVVYAMARYWLNARP